MMKFLNRLKWVFCLSFIFSFVFGQEQMHHDHKSHGDHGNHSHGPIGVSNSHQHSKGELMFSYRYSTMAMKDNYKGSRKVSTTRVLDSFMVSPKEMTMQMHMVGVMYGVTEKLMIMGMIPYVSITMDHVNAMGMGFTTKADGIGDVSLSGTYLAWGREDSKLLINLGLRLPTGSLEEKDDTPMGKNQKLPYPMQIGSGTYDAISNLTYTGTLNSWSWGGQANTVFRLNENDKEYKLGSEYGLTVWGAKKINRYIASTLRLDGKNWNDIDGKDPELNPMMVPTARTDLRGGERIDVLLGFDFSIGSKGFMKGNRLAVEAGFPIYQHLNGPQLGMSYRFMFAWQATF